MGEFVDFDEAVFPYVFECADCGAELHVSHEEAERSAHPGVTIRQAANTVRQSKGWWKDPDRVHCPECVTTLEERSEAIRQALTAAQIGL